MNSRAQPRMEVSDGGARRRIASQRRRVPKQPYGLRFPTGIEQGETVKVGGGQDGNEGEGSLEAVESALVRHYCFAKSTRPFISQRVLVRGGSRVCVCVWVNLVRSASDPDFLVDADKLLMRATSRWAHLDKCRWAVHP